MVRSVLLASALMLGLSAGASANVLVGLGNNNTLHQFVAGQPGDIVGSAPVGGLEAGEQLVSIDYDWVSGKYYGLGSASTSSNAATLYSLNLGYEDTNPYGGVAPKLNSVTATRIGAAGAQTIGTPTLGYGFDVYNGAAVILNNNGVYSITNAADGSAAGAGAVQFLATDINGGTRPMSIVGLARGQVGYVILDNGQFLGSNPVRNGFLASFNTFVGGQFVTINPAQPLPRPNRPDLLFTTGDFNFTPGTPVVYNYRGPSSIADLDIRPEDAYRYASFKGLTGQDQLFDVALNGLAGSKGRIGLFAPDTIIDITFAPDLEPVPAPAALGLFGLGLAAVALRRRAK